MSNNNLITSRAVDYVSETFNISANKIKITKVGGGYSLNRRSIAEFDDKKFFVKEVDDSLVEGNGDTERGWLHKDHQVMELLRTESIDIVPEWSIISDDRNILITTAYPSDDGWFWGLPEDTKLRHEYIITVVDAAKRLETATFSKDDVDRLSLEPYFRDKLSDTKEYNEFINLENRNEKLVQKLESIKPILSEHQLPKILKLIEAVNNNQLIDKIIPEFMASLKSQPNSVFGHCDLRPDNLAYNPSSQKVVIVDWNWTSITPEKFGSTEFLIACAFKGADISEYYGEINKDLLGTLIGFWLMGCLRPNLGKTTKLRDHQAISAAVAYSIYQNIL